MNKPALSMADVLTRRKSRTYFGYALLGCTVSLLAYAGWMNYLLPRYQVRQLPIAPGFIAAWIFAILVFVVTRFRRKVVFSFGKNLPAFAADDLASNLSAHRFRIQSIAVPLMALSLITPLSLHLLASWLVDERGFIPWMMASALLVGHAHLAIMIFALVHAKRKSAERAMAMPGVWAWGIAVLCAGLTTFVLSFVGVAALLPMAIVAVTGVFLPVIYHLVDRAWEEEDAAQRNHFGMSLTPNLS